MHTATPLTIVAVIAAALVLTQAHPEGVDVQVAHDKTFDFRTAKTWGWNSTAAGELKMARTANDDHDAMKRRAEPVILDAVASEMTRRGLKQDAAAPDLTVTYFLLLTVGSESQTAGQFMPTAMWGLPPFAPATTSLKYMNRGSLVLDLSAKGVVVWRGVAQGGVEMGSSDKKRESVLREGVRDLLKRYPPKP